MKSVFVHYDEARNTAVEAIGRWIQSGAAVERVLLITDLFGKLRLILWPKGESFMAQGEALEHELRACGPWWGGEMLLLAEASGVERELWENAWGEARPDRHLPSLRTLSRHRTRSAWFVPVGEPSWQAPENGPPIVVFYSFKGGVGRSTALASFAIQRAGAGDRVAIVDFDLDAPGIGRLLAADDAGTISPWGVVDYLVERAHGEVPIEDYAHRCTRVAGAGEIVVFPAGTLDESYADKLARVDLEEQPPESASPVVRLLENIKRVFEPRWVLLDARTGVSESAGNLLSGLAHLHVLFGTTSSQSWLGLRTVIDRLGRQKILAGQPQAEIVLVQSMVPPTPEAARTARSSFADQARDEFTERYYAEAPLDPADLSSERFCDIRDLDSADAPHVPVSVTYDPRLG